MFSAKKVSQDLAYINSDFKIKLDIHFSQPYGLLLQSRKLTTQMYVPFNYSLSRH